MRGPRRLPAAVRRAAVLGAAALLAGCDVFAPRTPEPPGGEPSVFAQPDTPERVVENLQRAVAAKDPTAYRRSLAEAFAFAPTPEALARDAVWAGWDAAAEEAAARTLFAAAQPAGSYALLLTDLSTPEVSDRRYVLAAAYVLTATHRRPEAPTTVRGRLRWTITRGADGLWALAEWTDESLGAGVPSWSDLKAAFAR